MRNPTAKEILLPEFSRLWKAIKGWDVEDTPGEGYHGITGTNVITILDALGITNKGKVKVKITKRVKGKPNPILY
jgi:hypothetical protein